MEVLAPRGFSELPICNLPSTPFYGVPLTATPTAEPTFFPIEFVALVSPLATLPAPSLLGCEHFFSLRRFLRPQIFFCHQLTCCLSQWGTLVCESTAVPPCLSRLPSFFPTKPHRLGLSGECCRLYLRIISHTLAPFRPFLNPVTSILNIGASFLLHPKLNFSSTEDFVPHFPPKYQLPDIRT